MQAQVPRRTWISWNRAASTLVVHRMLSFRLLLLVTTFLSCSGVKEEPAVEEGIAPFSLEALQGLRDRATYARLDRQDVGKLAQAAQHHWNEEFQGFQLVGVERFAAGGVSHWMSIWIHDKTGLEFALLPGGVFQMGSPPQEAHRREDEVRHSVTLDPFLIARTECTWDAWRKGAGIAGQVGASFDGSTRLPVNGIGPVDVEIWCQETGLTFPTEAQWEYMCRAGTETPWSSGDKKEALAPFANLGSLECPEQWIGMAGITEDWFDGYGDHPAPVGSFASNAFGLFDVHGNLSEWCRDEYFDYGAVKAEPGNGTRRGKSGERLARGGNFGGDATAARSSRRLTTGPGILPNGGGNHGFGFRPSVDLPLTKRSGS